MAFLIRATTTLVFRRRIECMGPTRPDRDLGGDTLTAYEFAVEEVSVASSKLARAFLARTLARGKDDSGTLEREAHLVYEKMIDLYPRVRLDDTQRASLLQELALLRSRLEECEGHQGKARTIRR
jgi:hypothetical protein